MSRSRIIATDQRNEFYGYADIDAKVEINEIAMTNNLVSRWQFLQYVRNDLESVTYLYLLVSDHALDAFHAF